MKKRAAIIFIALLLTVAFAGQALASSATYEITERFLEYLGENGIKYTYLGLSDSGKERVSIKYSGDVKDTVEVRVFFSEDETTVSLQSWYVIGYDESQFADVLYACNKLNYDYKFCRFYCDETDNTVTTQYDLTLPAGIDCSEAIFDAVNIMVDIVDIAYEDIGVYDTAA